MSKKKQICRNCYYCSTSDRISTDCRDNRVAYCLLDGRRLKLSEGTCTQFQYPIVKELYFRDTKEILPETIQQQIEFEQFVDFIQDEMEKTDE